MTPCFIVSVVRRLPDWVLIGTLALPMEFPPCHAVLPCGPSRRHFMRPGLSLFIALGVAANAVLGQRPREPVAPGSEAPARVSIVADSYSFEPKHIVVKVGTPVELTVVKRGVTPHSFVIKAPEANVIVEQDLGAQPVLIRFTPTAPGKFAFYCSNKLPFMASHRERGMEGVLEVQP